MKRTILAVLLLACLAGVVEGCLELGHSVFGGSAKPTATLCTHSIHENSELNAAIAAGGTTCLAAGEYAFHEMDNVKPTTRAILTASPGARVTLDGIRWESDENITVRSIRLKNVELLEEDKSIRFEGDFWHEADCGIYEFAWEHKTMEYIEVLHSTFEDINWPLVPEATCTGQGLTAITDPTGTTKHLVIDDNTFGPYIADHYTQVGAVEDFEENGNTFVGPSVRYEHGEEVHQNILQLFDTATNVTFDNNRMIRSGTNAGSLLFQGNGQKHNVQVNNNLFDEDAEGYSVQIYPIEGLEFEHNTIVRSHWGVFFRHAETADETLGDDYTVTNNIIVENTGNTANIVEEGCTTSCEFDYNVTSDTSATGSHSVTDWTPSWHGEFLPLGLSFDAGYSPFR